MRVVLSLTIVKVIKLQRKTKTILNMYFKKFQLVTNVTILYY